MYMSKHTVLTRNHLTGFIDRNKDGIVNEQDKYRFHKPAADVFTVSIQAKL
jgi:hypothetical protein